MNEAWESGTFVQIYGKYLLEGWIRDLTELLRKFYFLFCPPLCFLAINGHKLFLEIRERIDVITKQKTHPEMIFQKQLILLNLFLFSAGGLDLIFMPGLGFDKHGNRLGRGKGYYDTYLKRCLQHQEVKPYTLALAFKEQICLQVPVNENDMKVDEVLYEDSSAS